MDNSDKLSFYEVVKAYKKCRLHKAKNLSTQIFTFDLEKNLYDLYQDLITGNYKIGRSNCFVVLNPKVREIWAADFRDRVVHHILYDKIFDLFLKRFINDTFSCIPNRGTSKAVSRLEYHAQKITANYTKTAYYMKSDIRNFFVSIDKKILFDELKKLVNDEWILEILKQVIYNDVKLNAVIKSPKWKFKLLPEYKSLWHVPNNQGLPIGNLTSQFFSNVYLNVLDQYVKHKLKCKYYCRYVDDFIIMSENISDLNLFHKELSVFLYKRLKLNLHNNKKTINKIEKGMDFVGYTIKPNRKYLRQKTLHKIFEIIKLRKQNQNWFYINDLSDYINTINSYLGMLRGINGYYIRENICRQSIDLFTGCDNAFTKLFSNRILHLAC
ncbi:MAG: RNA-directed DNA polymerase [Candidatus Gastranaerophilales bacterium]|nr:RNA-directed DNA polymerase [Candidatus Gastranaerophilales bacterium]